MKMIGLVGGIAPESTIDYYRRLLAGYRERQPDGSQPAVLINSIDLKKMLGMIGAGQLAEVTDYLVAEVERLRSCWPVSVPDPREPSQTSLHSRPWSPGRPVRRRCHRRAAEP